MKKTAVKKKAQVLEGEANIFIAWAGDRSKAVAQGLALWLPKLIDGARPWMSDENLRSGTAWFSEITRQLETIEFGIICLTPDNLPNQWIHFEAGALAKRVSRDARVTPYLIGVTPRQVTSPFSAFQAREALKTPTHKLVMDINHAIGSAVSSTVLDERFELFWPKLEEVLSNAEAVPGPVAKIPKVDDMVAEMLGMMRSMGADLAKALDFSRGFIPVQPQGLANAFYAAQAVGLPPGYTDPAAAGREAARRALQGNMAHDELSKEQRIVRISDMLLQKRASEWSVADFVELDSIAKDLPPTLRRHADKLLKQVKGF